MELLDDVVYQTEPMIHAQKKKAKEKPLEMNIVDNAKASELSASLEVLLERRRQVRTRESLCHADAMIALEQKLRQLDAAA